MVCGQKVSEFSAFRQILYGQTSQIPQCAVEDIVSFWNLVCHIAADLRGSRVLWSTLWETLAQVSRAL